MTRSRISSAGACSSAIRSSSPALTASAISWGERPVWIIALPTQWAMPRSRAPAAWTWSTSTLGSGASSASAPSTPSIRVTVRSTDTEVRPAIRSETPSAISRAAALHSATMPWSRPSLELIADP